MSKKDDALRLALEVLEASRRTHHYCEDTWYSCPKHEDGCANESEGDECNCGADEANAQIDKTITAIREALAEQPAQQQEPVLWLVNGIVQSTDIPADYTGCLFTSPQPSKPWVGLTDEEMRDLWDGHTVPVFGKTGINPIVFANAIEAKLKEKNA